jgi:hypothetical protein
MAELKQDRQKLKITQSQRIAADTPASWTAAAVCRFYTLRYMRKRQRAAAVQNLAKLTCAEFITVHIGSGWKKFATLLPGH